MFLEGMFVLTVVAGCYAECNSSKCSQILKSFEYLSCVDYNACLLNKNEGACTTTERDTLMPTNCRCYVVCNEQFRNTLSSRQAHFCYYRGELEKCIRSNPFCLDVSTYLLNDFEAKCPCKVENCLSSRSEIHPRNLSCTKSLSCLSGGPVANEYAGCASAKAVRKVMEEKNYQITNPKGTWILNKECRCVNICAKEQLEYWPTCGPAQRLAQCYVNAGCSIDDIKPNLVLCACEEVCRTEISAIVSAANASIDLLCNNYRKYGDCLKRYGCTKRDLRLTNIKILDEYDKYLNKIYHNSDKALL
ncbi:Hypothetical predicted protein [Octopus vulgaris]|uniref:Uncharacterized protein n=1 Tax=Octopus vulgaris TaxID=6645 RepID=A0AA36FAA7_OCTVU|nr:Hypothetical predicted protein [Octopus vulgaris]